MAHPHEFVVHVRTKIVVQAFQTPFEFEVIVERWDGGNWARVWNETNLGLKWGNPILDAGRFRILGQYKVTIHGNPDRGWNPAANVVEAPETPERRLFTVGYLDVDTVRGPTMGTALVAAIVDF